MKLQSIKTIPFNRVPLAAVCATLALSAVNSPQVQAQQSRGTATLLEEVVVTARKRDEGAQEVPMSINVFSSDQLDALKVRDLFSLSVGMPNVVLDDVGTARGTANFSIRGLGINSSIPGLDPTVGVFINQVFLGNTVGSIFDTFDLASIEVLRGPQGILFGRNVTGGAVLLNTKRPGEELDGEFKVASDITDSGDLNTYYMGAMGGPITDTLGGRLTVYYNEDDGWVENKFDGEEVGEIEQFMVRPTVSWAPMETLEFVVMYQYTDINGDGPVAQSHRNFAGVDPQQFEPNGFSIPARNSFDVAFDERGFQKSDDHFLTFETNWDVAFGNGTITNIFGYRNGDGETRSDIDGQPVWLFHAQAATDNEQFSNELRYNGVFDERANVTVGLYLFDNDIKYDENRDLGGVLLNNEAPFATFHGGGNLNTESLGIFSAVDYDLTAEWTLNLGLRYTFEEKEAEVATLPPSQDNPCSVINDTCNLDFVDEEDWDSWSPKVGATYHVSDSAQLYASWSRGFRSGGYNLRNTSTDPADVPGPFSQEEVDSFEVGYKSTHGRGRLNAALFYNDIDDMQREVNKAGPIGVIQLIQNTADARIWGVEVDATYAVLENLLFFASLGYIDAEYETVNVDLNEDGVIDSGDENLDLPRAPEWTYSVGVSHDLDIGNWGYLTTRVNYAYRDDTAFTDSNFGSILEQEVLDAGLDFNTNDGHWVLSLYGRNLLDETKHGGDTQLPDDLGGVVPWGGTFSPLARGRHYGAEVRYKFF